MAVRDASIPREAFIIGAMSSNRRSARQFFLANLALLAMIGVLFAKAKDFVRPVAKPAGTYPAHDAHADENVVIAADPYDTPEKAKIFSMDFVGHGLLPVFLVITNDGAQPVSVAKMEITLTTGKRARLTPITNDDIYRRFSNPQSNVKARELPLPLPRKIKGAVTQKEMDEITSSEFAARAVEPHGTQSGFLFFDIDGVDDPLAGSTIYITGVNDAAGKELMYFEVPLQKYLDAGHAK